MRKAWKWLGRLAAVVLVLLVVLLLSAYGLSERRMARVYRIDPPVPAVPTDAAAVDRGSHIAAIRGCKCRLPVNQCHAKLEVAGSF